MNSVAAPDQIKAWLAGLADAAATRYLEYGHGNAVMLWCTPPPLPPRCCARCPPSNVIKFADTAADVHARTGCPVALGAVIRAAELIAPKPPP
jgi:hypothetical protein